MMARREPDTTWRREFETARKESGDESPVAHVSPDWASLDVPFFGGYGGSNGPHVLIWTDERVYFPVVYDGAEWLGSAPRNPTSEGQCHVGGE